jgi:ABC-2 type transport system ATP-binding protein
MKMVEVRNLSKRYGRQTVLADISFTARPGRILGFLGPNGAGKSTTMRILSGFLLPSGGEVSVCGFSIRQQSLEVRRRIGYLPEDNPQYEEMYVREALEFAAGIFNLNNRKGRINEVIRMTGLEPEQHKQIGTLSKGYRQRAGLAQAILHDPQVLLLDEPTSGLDPGQLVAIRKLIADLGKSKTIILSTHIMQEVKALCQDVLMINAGRVVADFEIGQQAALFRTSDLDELFLRLIHRESSDSGTATQAE